MTSCSNIIETSHNQLGYTLGIVAHTTRTWSRLQ